MRCVHSIDTVETPQATHFMTALVNKIVAADRAKGPDGKDTLGKLGVCGLFTFFD